MTKPKFPKRSIYDLSLRLTVPDKIPSFLSQTSAAPRSTALVGDSGHIALFTTNSFLLDGEEYGKPFSGARIDVLYQQD